MGVGSPLLFFEFSQIKNPAVTPRIIKARTAKIIYLRLCLTRKSADSPSVATGFSASAFWVGGTGLSTTDGGVFG